MSQPEKYLIIGGSTKCGTTSVFKYFEFHPQICPCRMKESRYFLESDYQLIAKQRNSEKHSQFSELFSNCKSNSVRLEATPDYIYSTHASTHIRKELENVKLVFILRNPVDRLKSWYKFAKLNGLIDKNETFDNYVYSQNKNDDNAQQHLSSLKQGKYSMHIENYLNVFGAENIHICFYENLVHDAESFCKEIAEFAGIDAAYFNNYSFKIYNKSVPVKSVSAHQLFRKFKRTVRPVTRMLFPSLRKRLKLAGYKFEQAYSSANADELQTQTTMNAELEKFLHEYYYSDIENLVRQTGKKLPW